MKLGTETRKLRLIILSWSSSLPIDDVTGESIVTKADLLRLMNILTLIFGSSSEPSSENISSTTSLDS